jgi:hypothetical protein
VKGRRGGEGGGEGGGQGDGQSDGQGRIIPPPAGSGGPVAPAALARVVLAAARLAEDHVAAMTAVTPESRYGRCGSALLALLALNGTLLLARHSAVALGVLTALHAACVGCFLLSVKC